MGQRIKCLLPWLLGVLVVILGVLGPRGFALSPAPESSPLFPSSEERSLAPHSPEGLGPTADHLVPEGTPLYPPKVLPRSEVLPPAVHVVLPPASSPHGLMIPGKGSGRTIPPSPTVKSPAPSVAISDASAASPLPVTSPAIHGSRHNILSPAPQENSSGKDKHRLPDATSPYALSGHTSSKNHFHEPALSPSITSPNQFKKTGMPVAASPTKISTFSNHAKSHPKGSAVSPVSTMYPAVHQSNGMPVAASPNSASNTLSSGNHTHTNGSLPARHLAPRGAKMPPDDAHAPLSLHAKPPHQSMQHSPSSGPAASYHLWARQRKENPASAPSHPFPAPDAAHAPFSSSSKKPQVVRRYHSPSSPSAVGKRREKPAFSPSHSFPPRAHKSAVRQSGQNFHATSPLASPIAFPVEGSGRVPAPSPSVPSIHLNATRPVEPPALSPQIYPGKQIPPSPQPTHALPPPPPNIACTPLSCPEPMTNSPPGAPCACVLPINVGLCLSISLYTFFPLVSDFAQEISSGVLMKQSQVRIMGANAADENPERTIVLLDLVPLDKFDNNTAFFVYERFWHKKVFINSSLFGVYSVLYVHYPGLPASPPAAPGNIDTGNSNKPLPIYPLAVDVRKHEKKRNASVISIIVLSAVIAIILGLGATFLLVLKCRENQQLPTSVAHISPSLSATGVTIGPPMFGSRRNSGSISFSSSIAAYTGSAKTFSLSEMERATDKFDNSRIIGEGGFGHVYEGTLDDGTKVAIKIPKRDDQQGSREFLAEVEMLSRLHHRNLIKLIGICTEENIRCLVYEFVPNGSVDSHLHGADKEAAPLDWNARLKIALGAARGLAYLHEDSSPCVIHRDFKSSNILLEEDFTPKVSDFGLARTALDEGKDYISTRVMGTFGYVAPEYAMTGHLLVKSDVYSYGVVLLELLTGRKPVDMLRLPGQENLVTWARPFLTSKDGLESILDPSLGTDITFESVAKVAAIASMCVQPEVSQRPFMGEVVQALKLICSEEDNHRGSGSFSQEDIVTRDRVIKGSISNLEVERVLSASDIFATSPSLLKDTSGSFRRYSSSGPLRPGSRGQFWHGSRKLSTGSASEHGGLRKGSGATQEWM